MSKVKVGDFVGRVEQIAGEEPTYEKGYDGSRGLCDCIGLIIGAIRRAGGSWSGIHGSNYAARNEMESLEKIGKRAELQIGEAVYKAYEPGESKYSLPDRYKKGSDLRDYYHVGVVVSVEPLRIRHMTTPKPKVDTSLGRWAWHGRLKKIDYSAGGSSGGGGKPDMQQATVVLPSGSKGSTVNLRKTPEQKSGNVIAQVPVGTVVDVIEDMGQWCRIEAQGFTGYMMSNYIEYPGQGEEMEGDLLTAEEREKIDHALMDIENRIETIREILGRG